MFATHSSSFAELNSSCHGDAVVGGNCYFAGSSSNCGDGDFGDFGCSRKRRAAGQWT